MAGSNNNGSGFLTRDQILAGRDTRTEEAEIQALGGKVRLRRLGWDEAIEVQRRLDKVQAEHGDDVSAMVKEPGLVSYILSLILCDSDGDRLFTTDEDLRELGQLPPSVVMEIMPLIAEKLRGEEAERAAGEGSTESQEPASSSA